MLFIVLSYHYFRYYGCSLHCFTSTVLPHQVRQAYHASLSGFIMDEVRVHRGTHAQQLDIRRVDGTLLGLQDAILPLAEKLRIAPPNATTGQYESYTRSIPALYQVLLE